MENNELTQEKSDKASSGDRKPSWVPGVVLILIGGVFLLRNYYPGTLENWWALFILFPALSNFSRGVELIRTVGFNRSARSHMFWGIFFSLLSASFLFSLDFSLIWPVFLIFAGLAMLLGAF